jgi:hypothetical protein
VSPKQDPVNQKVWEVVATFSSHSGDPAKENPHAPTLDPPDIHWGSWTKTVVAYVDLDGKHFVNSAGQGLDPPVERVLKFPALTVVRNEATFPINYVQTYWDVVNSDVFNGWAPETVKVDDIRAASQYREAQGFFRVTYEFLFNPLGWNHHEIDQGPSHLEENDAGDQVRVTNKLKGIATTNVLLLDGQGDLLSQSEIDAGNVVITSWRMHDKKPFSVFGF